MHRSAEAKRWDNPRQGYVPAIDGLRFFAIGSVLLFHLWRPLLPGGFVGVDIFFVISGYLITGVLTNPQRAPTLAQFYQNRIARIAPASMVTIVATLVAGSLLYDQQAFAYLGSAALFAATSTINIKLLFQSSYFAASPIAQPLLHFWSLAVEEQFYLVYPAALILLRRFGLPRVIAVAGVVSFAICLWLTWRQPSWAFYLLPARAWELCAGGWLALRTRRHGREQPLGWVGLALVMVSFMLISDSRAFPGWQALLPVVGTMLMLDATRVGGRFSDFLEARPFVWVGLRSYSLYLWHWPVYSFVDYALWQQGSATRLGLKIVLTFVLALASYAFIEKPSRERLRGRRARLPTFAGFLAVVLMIGFAGASIRNSYYLSAEGGLLRKGGYAFDPGGRPRVAVIGDSEGAMYGTMFRDIARERGWQLRLLAAAATNELADETKTRWPELEPWLRRDRPDVTVIIYAWTAKLRDGAALDRTLARLGGLGSRTVIMLQPPSPSVDKAYDPRIDGRLIVPDANRVEREAIAMRIRPIASRHPRAMVVDPAPLFLNRDGTVIVAVPGGQPLFYDSTHLSRPGAERVAPLLERAVNAASRAPRSIVPAIAVSR